jgi:hypothetical protein
MAGGLLLVKRVSPRPERALSADQAPFPAP